MKMYLTKLSGKIHKKPSKSLNSKHREHENVRNSKCGKEELEN